mmetsp:Transcript_4585/g.7851  ORF Transcript_4585/g.7851 Transcript_4585/m.7851 type:complete len:259 (+) Transcript_4585:257-1033(+)|eukprot:CAMPEP_0119109370 /NCGR_PEP_ID=MMETSP1180-20130426/17871_1 /TAXON_ID=3052 ORGANISM="Chlamydomonas cf sp, Strain CCMP681" /NCGR_SAMPLE_ID=MMETSP1180 /ASSEMBLY_ACC=CAM_ASM_000741 /LENGTH=258 /DNA_ID=CAMNT_0007095117 /DNA_START=257 /DNA_END=1033 /DNA_ORIENTATION=-
MHRDFSGATCLLIDLDDCLYRSHDIADIVRHEIQDYMVQNLGVSVSDVQATTLEMYTTYGTTMAGLVANGHEIDVDHWHKTVHHNALDYETLLQPDPALRELLLSIPVPKWVLTNADTVHAQLCLDRLGIRDCFEEVFDFEWMQAEGTRQGIITPSMAVLCKPNPQAYTCVLKHLKREASQVAFFDDSTRNIMAAQQLGIFTVLVGKDEPHPGADLSVLSMHHLPLALPSLFKEVQPNGKPELDKELVLQAACNAAAV